MKSFETVFHAQPETLKKTRNAVLKLSAAPDCPDHITVELENGCYSPSDFTFNGFDSSTAGNVSYVGKEKTILHGRLTVEKD